MRSLAQQRTCDEIQEGEALEIFGLLVAELHDLVVALPQGLHAEPVPGVLVIQVLRRTYIRSVLHHRLCVTHALSPCRAACFRFPVTHLARRTA